MTDVPTNNRSENMETVIINFQLEGITEAEYEQVCEALAPTFAALPGLDAKIWLADSASNSYGGVYTFATAAEAGQFLSSQLFADIEANPHLVGVTARRFGVLEEPTRITRGLV